MAKIILTTDVANLGGPGDIVEVKDGYARNYLLPRGYAIVASKGAEKNVRTINEMSHGMGLVGQVARWVLGKPSILALSPSLVHWFWRSDDSLDYPDLQGVFSPASYKQIVELANVVSSGHGLRTRATQVPPTEVRYLRVGQRVDFEVAQEDERKVARGLHILTFAR